MKNYEGEERKIGIEIEFYGLKPKETADLVAGVLGGDIERKHEDLFVVHTSFGDFGIETDADLIKKLSEHSEENTRQNKSDIDGLIVNALKVVSDEVLPTEIVSPPLYLKDIETIHRIQKELKQHGAQGTTESIRFAFAAQLNPEIESNEVTYLLNILKSYILLSDWLKDQIGMDITRKLTSFASDFPKKYQKKIFKETYRPSLEEFITDYLEYNPTRNRGLDMLPLFSFLNDDLLREYVKDSRVKSRPTFHYRLPNCQLGLRYWNVEVEWKRWLLVEKVAKSEKDLLGLSQCYLDFLNEKHNADWLLETKSFVELFRS